MKNKLDLFKGLALITENYQTEFSNAQIELWDKLFTDWTAQEFESAIIKHITDPEHGRFKPLPAHIFKHKPKEPNKPVKPLVNEMDMLRGGL